MKRIVMSIALVLLVLSIGMTQDEAAGERTAAEQPEAARNAAADDVAQTSPLDELDWLVGEWVDQGGDTTIATSYSRTLNRRFLTGSFSITTDGQVTLEGTQLIGWDPIEKRIHSWTFDSEGGFGEGRWMRDGDRWLVKTSFVLASGEQASSLNVFAYVDADTFRWQSTGREIGGELQPSIPEVTVVRKKTDQAKSEQDTKEVSK